MLFKLSFGSRKYSELSPNIDGQFIFSNVLDVDIMSSSF